MKCVGFLFGFFELIGVLVDLMLLVVEFYVDFYDESCYYFVGCILCFYWNFFVDLFIVGYIFGNGIFYFLVFGVEE